MQDTQLLLVKKLLNCRYYHQEYYDDKLSIIGNGVVLDPWALKKEIDL